MAIPIIDSLLLATDLPLDSRTVVNIPYDGSRYFYAGFIGFESSGNLPFYIDNSLGIQYFGDGIGVSQIYVDGSLAARDISINYLNNYNGIQDLSINLIKNDIIQIEASIGIINNELFQLDASIVNLENSKVNRSGDTMTGDLIIETDLSVNGKGTFAEFNVSGIIFPTTPISGDKFYRIDLETDFQYDSSRGKWLSVNRNTFSAGNNRSNAGNTKYLSIGTAVMDSITGIHMWKHGVITKLSVQNNRTIGGAGRSLELRVNNSITYKETITITTGNTGAFKFSNLDVSSGDIIQILTVPGSDRIDDIIFNFEVAERA